MILVFNAIPYMGSFLILTLNGVDLTFNVQDFRVVYTFMGMRNIDSVPEFSEDEKNTKDAK